MLYMLSKDIKTYKNKSFVNYNLIPESAILTV